jgi:hypothetical protein
MLPLAAAYLDLALLLPNEAGSSAIVRAWALCYLFYFIFIVRLAP